MKLQGHELLFKAIIGSQAYGTNIETSDTDYKGVFIQDPKDLYLNGYKDEIQITKDEVYYEIGKFIKSCAGGNPTCLELLFSPERCIVHNTPAFQKLIDNRDKFLTKNLRHSFSNYAFDQIRKATGTNKKMNWDKEKMTRKTVEDMCSVYSFPDDTFKTNGIKLEKWLNDNNLESKDCGLVKIEHFRDCYLLFANEKFKYKGITSGENANEVSLSQIEKEDRPVAMLFFHMDAYSRHCKEYREYQEWLEKRNEDRYVETIKHKQKIDGKNMLHCIRLIETAMDIPILKTIKIERDNKDFLISIRKGKHDLQKLIDKSEKDVEEMKKLFMESDLPNKFIEKEFLDDYITETRLKYYEN